MYLAPLNYDRYFKKVFSDTSIAKCFLEDFLNVQIQSIELLSINHKLTDDSSAVEFDFRCKIDDRFIIIDMQQWYKPDIVHRFYVYHCINTAMQLESLPFKSFSLGDKPLKEKKIKDYSEILPVITLIWMADDSFNFTDDFVGYTMTPEIVSQFLSDNLLWQQPDIKQVLREREKVLAQLNNKTRSLDFLQENRLIYAFQQNIVKNGRFTRYHKWFELAEKTKNKLNKKAEFLKYKDDQILLKLMERISKEALSADDFTYIDDYEQYLERVKRYDKGKFKEGWKEGKLEGKLEGKAEGDKLRAQKTALKLLLRQIPLEEIAEITELSIKDIQFLKQLLEKHGGRASDFLK
jgi:hypothetical protein